MAKRFTDTELYDKDWFVALPPNFKLFWHYITSKCDNAGIWDVNIITACRVIGIEEINIENFAEACNADGKERILIFSNKRKIFISTTIHFQCGTKLNENIPAHRGVITSLYAYPETTAWINQQLDNSLLTLSNGLDRSCVTQKDKDKDYNINREKEGMGEKEEEIKISSDPAIHVREVLFSAECMVFKDKYGEDMILDFIRYWTEPNKSKSKMRFEREPTWDLSRRLTTWENNNKTNFGRKNGSTTNTANKKQALGEYGTRTSTL